MWNNNKDFEQIIQESIILMEAILYIKNHKHSYDNFSLIQIIPVDVSNNLYGYGLNSSKVDRLQFSILFYEDYNWLENTLLMIAYENKLFLKRNVNEIFSIKKDEDSLFLVATTLNKYNCSYKKIMKQIYKTMTDYFQQHILKFDGSRIMCG